MYNQTHFGSVNKWYSDFHNDSLTVMPGEPARASLVLKQNVIHNALLQKFINNKPNHALCKYHTLRWNYFTLSIFVAKCLI